MPDFAKQRTENALILFLAMANVNLEKIVGESDKILIVNFQIFHKIEIFYIISILYLSFAWLLALLSKNRRFFWFW